MNGSRLVKYDYSMLPALDLHLLDLFVLLAEFGKTMVAGSNSSIG